MRKLFLLLVITALLILSFGWWKKNTSTNQKKLLIGNKVTINIDIADDEEERQQGYSHHPPISNQEGLLFIMPKPALHTFWMKDMLFDLDFIYIRNNQVVQFIENVPAPIHNNGEIKYVNPKTPVDQVLEVKSGFVKKYHIQLHDPITIN